ncbi:thioredoxin [bacterium]|nr:MAG: thioredoxin [bacterium]
MNAESFNTPPAASNQDDIAAKLAELDDLQRQRNASPYSGTIVTLALFGTIGLPLLFFGIVKAGTMLFPNRGLQQAPAMAVAADAPRSINWIYEVKAGSQLAVSVNKPMMISFYTDWCPACKSLDAKTYTHPAVAAEADNFVSVKINAEGQPAIANQYSITKYPTIVWTDSVGNEKYRQVGGSSPEDFVNTMSHYR